MSQHDYNIANNTFPAFRSDLNNALSAIQSNNSGSSSPSTTTSYMQWADTSNNILKIRNSADNDWISILKTDGVQQYASGNTSSLPAFSKADDIDTGILFPAADTLAISTGGAERLRLDSSGNFGIGTSSPKLTSFTQKTLTVSTTGKTLIEVVGNASGSDLFVSGISFHNQASSSSDKRIAQVVAYRDTDDDAGALFFSTADTGGSLTEKMRIDSSGNLGIGTNAPDTHLHIDSTDQGNFTEAMRISNTAGGANEGSYIQWEVSNSNGYGARLGGRREGTGGVGLHFYTGAINAAPTEKMRISSDGKVGINSSNIGAQLDVFGPNTSPVLRLLENTSGTLARFEITPISASTGINVVAKQTSGAGVPINFLQGFSQTLVMKINATGKVFMPSLASSGSGTNVIINPSTGELYEETSSLQFKKQVQDIKFDTSKLYDIRPRTFIRLESDVEEFGLIAEEVTKLIPDVVSFKNNKPYSINYAKLVVPIIAEMKKLKAEILEMKKNN